MSVSRGKKAQVGSGRKEKELETVQTLKNLWWPLQQAWQRVGEKSRNERLKTYLSFLKSGMIVLAERKASE